MLETMIRNGRFRSPTNHPGSTVQTDSHRFLTRCSSPNLSHYMVLGLTPHASQAEVKRVYKRLALKYHPDVHKGPEKDFKEIKSAYEVKPKSGRNGWDLKEGFHQPFTPLSSKKIRKKSLVAMNTSRIRKMESTIF